MNPFAQTLTPCANRVDADLNPNAGINGKHERVNADVAIPDVGVGPHSNPNIASGQLSYT